MSIEQLGKKSGILETKKNNGEDQVVRFSRKRELLFVIVTAT